MRVNRIRRMQILRKKRKKILFNFLILIPTISLIVGYAITDLIVLPIYFKQIS